MEVVLSTAGKHGVPHEEAMAVSSPGGSSKELIFHCKVCLWLLFFGRTVRTWRLRRKESG